VHGLAVTDVWWICRALDDVQGGSSSMLDFRVGWLAPDFDSRGANSLGASRFWRFVRLTDKQHSAFDIVAHGDSKYYESLQPVERAYDEGAFL